MCSSQNTKHKQAADKKIADLEEKIDLRERNQEEDNASWKDCVDRQKVELQRLKDNLKEQEKRKRGNDDQDDSPTQSKRSRIGSTTNLMHSEEEGEKDVEERLIQKLLYEKQQHIHEKQEHSKMIIEFLELKKELRSVKAQLNQQRNTYT